MKVALLLGEAHPDHKEGAMKLLLEVEAFLQSGGEELHALSFSAPGNDDSAVSISGEVSWSAGRG